MLFFGIGFLKMLLVIMEYLLFDGVNLVLWNVLYVYVINIYFFLFYFEFFYNFFVFVDGCFSCGIFMRKWLKNVIFYFYYNIVFI